MPGRPLVVTALLWAGVAAASDDAWLTRTTVVEVAVDGPVDAAAVRGMLAQHLGPSCVVVPNGQYAPPVSVNGDDGLPEADETAATEQESETTDDVVDADAPTAPEEPEVDLRLYAADGDKRLHVSVVPAGGRYRVSVREEDVWLHETGPTHAAVVDSETILAAEVARLVARVFRPRVLLRTGDDGVTGIPFGGAMFGPDPLVAEGDLLRPVLRFRERDDTWKETKPILWSYVRVTDADPMAMTLDLISAYPAPLPGRIRRGEIVGLRERPAGETTEVVVVGDADRRARAGLHVEVRPGKKAEKDGEQTKPPLFADLSDRRGRLTLPPLEPDVVWVSVRSTTTLANVPVRPGHERRVDLPVQEDKERVGLDERLSAVELKLTDLAARKAVHVARLKAAAKAEQWDKVQLSFDELDRMPDADDLIIDVNAARVEAVAAAEKRGDRMQAARLKRHADRLEETIENFADPTQDKELRDELRAIREVSDAAKKIADG